MRIQSSINARIPAAISLALVLGFASFAQNNSQPPAAPKGAPMTTRAVGTFEVNIVPQSQGEKAEGPTLARLSIDKQYHGDLEASGKGEMLTAGPDAKGSGAYVAIERVTGTIGGRAGSFVLQHLGTLTRGATELTITVVPDSGTGQLEGLTGKLNVIINNGKHSYEFDYSLPESR
jgi:Protein of unknown function (DUF3224)